MFNDLIGDMLRDRLDVKLKPELHVRGELDHFLDCRSLLKKPFSENESPVVPLQGTP